jgi:hypothetical protein
MLESGTCNDMHARFLPVACSCAVIVLCTASVACCWWWLASGLPSPPGSAPSLSFTSWTCSWLLLVLLLLRWAAGSSPPKLDLELQLDSMVLLEMFVWCYARTVAVLGVVQCWTCECCSPGTTHLVDCLALLAAVVLPAPASPSVTKLLVSYVPVYSSSLVWSIPWPCCASAMHPYTLYPQWFLKEQMLHLVNYTQWCNW